MLKVVAIVTGVIFLMLVLWVIWRWMSVGRGMRQRDERLLVLLDPIAEKIHAKQTISPQEIEELAGRPEIRHMLFAMLREMNRPDLLPSNYSTSVAQGASALVYWMMHPNEFQDAPAAIELVETLVRPIGNEDGEFHVFRYKMPDDHWAAKDGWMLGLAGPIMAGGEPYAAMVGAFSRVGDFEGKVTPPELVDWYLGMLRQKGIDLQ